MGFVAYILLKWDKIKLCYFANNIYFLKNNIIPLKKYHLSVKVSIFLLKTCHLKTFSKPNHFFYQSFKLFLNLPSQFNHIDTTHTLFILKLELDKESD